MKKLLIFLMIAIPLVVILVVNLTVNVVTGLVSISVESISLNQTEIRANIDDVISLEATILPKNSTNKDIIWQSTNEEVARVDLNGNITFIGFGQGYITATTVDGNKRASCYFYVTDTEVHQVMITSTEMQNGNYYVGIDEDLQLSSVVIPVEAIEKGVLYTSEDENIATVDANGLVHGITEGRVKITSTSESKPDISDFVIVEVVKPVERIEVSTETAVTSFNSYQISYSVYPNDASVSSVIYTSTDEEIAIVSPSGLVTFLKPGVVTIEITSVQGNKTTQIEVEYTNGYASDLILDVQTIEKSINDGGMYISYSTIPQSVDVDVEFSSDDENVVYIDDGGYVQFIGGGNTLIHAKIKKNETEYIDKVIRVFIESPATGIILDDNYVVATREFQLNPKSYPSTSTNTHYSYFSNDLSIATVDENGLITFVRDDYVSVPIDVYANVEKNIRKTIIVTYTKGFPTDIELESENIELDFGDIYQIGYTLHPDNVASLIADVKFEILSQNGNGDNDVLEVLEDGSIKTLGGGSATIEVSCALYGGTRVRKNVQVIVNKKVEDINFVTDLDYVEGEYVTSLQKVEFSISSTTQDATNKNVYWELANNNAIKSGANEITFNNAGIAEIKVFSEDQNIEKTIYIRYLKSNLIYAGITEIPQNIMVGEEVEVEILSLLPSNATASLSLKINNQITASEGGKVAEIVGQNKIKALAGGTANIVVKVANLQFTYTINFVKLSEEIIVTPANITTTKDRLILQTEVLPVDTTNKNVVFEVLNPDVASVDGNTIIFKKEGIASIKATAEDGSGAFVNFTIEKVAKGTGDVELNGEPIVMQVGEANIVNLSNVDFEYDSKEYVIRSQVPEVSGNNVVEIEDDKIKALSIGTATVDCILTNSFGIEKIISIEVQVIQISEDIEFNTELELLLGEYATATERVDLTFNILPQNTANKNYRTRILRFSSSITDYVAPYIENNQIVFGSVGVAVIEVSAEDEGTVKQFRIRYTGGDAVDAQLNVDGQKALSIGETFEIDVVKWIPHNTQNTQIYLRETYHTQNVSRVVSIEGRQITAIAGGESRISVELSNGITKEIVIVVLTKIESVEISDSIVSPETQITLNPTILPSNATNTTLNFSLQNEDIAYLNGRTVVFTNPGTVKVTISTTDGSNITKEVYVTSTFGYINDFDLSVTEKTINKLGQFTIFVTNTYPSGATHKDVMFELVDYQANGITQTPVVEVSATGLVKGIYGGTATVRAYTLDYYGNKIFKDVTINVISAVTGFDVQFNKNLLVNQGSYITAKSELKYSFNVYPQDATNQEIICESNDESVAIIYGNKINFVKEGMVVVKFTASDTTNGNIYKTYPFYYTEGRLLSLSVDESRFDSNKVLTLDAGDIYKFVATEFMPNDITNIEFSMADKNETRIDSTKPVAELYEDGELVAMNGGEITFTLLANGVSVGRYTIRVLRQCNEIVVDSTEAYVNNSNYQIVAKAYPLDTYQTKLVYVVVSGNGSVNADGLVTLGGAGVVEVKVSSFDKPSINKIIRIEYTNEVKKITFKQTVTQLYFNSRVDLIIIKEPLNVPDFEVVYTSSDETIATVNKNGRVITKEKAGEVVIRATVVGHPEIYAERTFTIIPVVASISLELDEVNDKNGIGGYRVWGKFFFTSDPNDASKFTIKNTYKMNIRSLEPSSASGVNLVWTSSNPTIATVDETGLVTFLTGGDVTISVEPEVQYNPALPVRDSYTFRVVNAVNYYSSEQLFRSMTLGVNQNDPYKNIVLQGNMDMGFVFELPGNLHGNGYLMNFNATMDQDGMYEKIKIKNNNILVDNVYIRGSQFGENAALSTLQKSGKLIRIEGEGEKIVNVRIRNCLLENALICTEVINAEVTYSGCIIRNSFSAGLILTRKSDSVTQADVTVKDCIFSKSLLSSILFNIEQAPKNMNYKTTLHVEGSLMIYNWLKIDEFNCDMIEKYAKDATTQIRNEIKKNPGYVYTYNGDEYVMLGISSINMDPPSAMGVIDVEKYSYKSVNNDVDFKGENPYTKAAITGQVTLYGGTVKCNVTMTTYTLTNTTTFITPATTYETDPNTYQNIRQPWTY